MLPTSKHPIPPFLQAVLPPLEAVRAARRRLHGKAAAILTLLAVSYAGLLLPDLPGTVRALAAVGFLHGLLATATGIMHDANHGSFSTSKRVNRWFGYTADLLGASSWLWRQQHNVAHHRYTNIAGLDGDIDQAPFARLEPGQQWRRHHRIQHWYMWVLYGFLVLKWVFVGDPTTLVSRYRSPERPTLREAVAVIAGKVLHGCFAFAIPLLFHPWQVVLVGYVVFTFLLGLLLAVTFQLAHCTDAVTFFPERPTTTGDAGAVHQLATTADFAPRGRLAAAYLGFCLGGLEYQVEHHLAPRLPHTAYRAMSAKVSAVCTERGLVHRRHRSPAAALASHYRHLRALAVRPACGTR